MTVRPTIYKLGSRKSQLGVSMLTIERSVNGGKSWKFVCECGTLRNPRNHKFAKAQLAKLRRDLKYKNNQENSTLLDMKE